MGAESHVPSRINRATESTQGTPLVAEFPIAPAGPGRVCGEIVRENSACATGAEAQAVGHQGAAYGCGAAVTEVQVSARRDRERGRRGRRGGGGSRRGLEVARQAGGGAARGGDADAIALDAVEGNGARKTELVGVSGGDPGGHRLGAVNGLAGQTRN